MKQAALAQKAKAVTTAKKAPVASYADEGDEEEDVPLALKKIVKKANTKVAELADDEDEAPVKAKGKAKKAIACPLDCGVDVPYDDLAKHVAKCTGPSEEETAGEE